MKKHDKKFQNDDVTQYCNTNLCSNATYADFISCQMGVPRQVRQDFNTVI